MRCVPTNRRGMCHVDLFDAMRGSSLPVTLDIRFRRIRELRRRVRGALPSTRRPPLVCCGASRERTYSFEAAAAASLLRSGQEPAPQQALLNSGASTAPFVANDYLRTRHGGGWEWLAGTRRFTVPGRFICGTRTAPPAVRQCGETA
jgi:hypothetical protein